MFGGMNPAKMQGMMKKMGISQEELPVRKVIFELADGNLIIEDPTVVKVKMQGQETYQVSGEAKSEETETYTQEDIEMVMQQTGKDEETVKETLQKNEGDIAETILELKA